MPWEFVEDDKPTAANENFPQQGGGGSRLYRERDDEAVSFADAFDEFLL